MKGDKSYVELLFTGVDGRDYLVHRDTRALRAVGDKPGGYDEGQRKSDRPLR